MLVAALITWLVAVFGGRVDGAEARSLALWSASAALGVIFTKMQLPLAIALVALALIVRPSFTNRREQLLLFGALVIGFGCGSGAALIMAIVSIPYLLIVRWAMPARAGRQIDEG